MVVQQDISWIAQDLGSGSAVPSGAMTCRGRRCSYRMRCPKATAHGSVNNAVAAWPTKVGAAPRRCHARGRTARAQGEGCLQTAGVDLMIRVCPDVRRWTGTCIRSRGPVRSRAGDRVWRDGATDDARESLKYDEETGGVLVPGVKGGCRPGASTRTHLPRRTTMDGYMQTQRRSCAEPNV